MKIRDTHVSPYKTAQKAGTPVRDTKNVKMRDTHVSPYKTAQGAGTLVRDTKYENEGHTCLSLQDRQSRQLL